MKVKGSARRMSPLHEGVHASDTSACVLWKQARCTCRWTSCRRRCTRGRPSGRPLITAPSRARTPGWCCRAEQASGPPGPPRCGTGQKPCRALLQPGLSSVGDELERARVSARCGKLAISVMLVQSLPLETLAPMAPPVPVLRSCFSTCWWACFCIGVVRKAVEGSMCGVRATALPALCCVRGHVEERLRSAVDTGCYRCGVHARSRLPPGALSFAFKAALHDSIECALTRAHELLHGSCRACMVGAHTQRLRRTVRTSAARRRRSLKTVLRSNSTHPEGVVSLHSWGCTCK